MRRETCAERVSCCHPSLKPQSKHENGPAGRGTTNHGISKWKYIQHIIVLINWQFVWDETGAANIGRFASFTGSERATERHGSGDSHWQWEICDAAKARSWLFLFSQHTLCAHHRLPREAGKKHSTPTAHCVSHLIWRSSATKKPDEKRHAHTHSISVHSFWPLFSPINCKLKFEHHLGKLNARALCSKWELTTPTAYFVCVYIFFFVFIYRFAHSRQSRMQMSWKECATRGRQHHKFTIHRFAGHRCSDDTDVDAMFVHDELIFMLSNWNRRKHISRYFGIRWVVAMAPERWKSGEKYYGLAHALAHTSKYRADSDRALGFAAWEIDEFYLHLTQNARALMQSAGDSWQWQQSIALIFLLPSARTSDLISVKLKINGFHSFRIFVNPW